MSLDLSKLQNVRHLANGRIEARCPACAEAGSDRQGIHLRIDDKGRFCCVVNAGPEGSEHRKRIFALAGKPSQPKTGFTIKVKMAEIRKSLSIKSSLKSV
jgi:hypothetical protein